MEPENFRMKALCAVAAVVASCLNSNAQISENPTIVPMKVVSNLVVLASEVDQLNMTTLYSAGCDYGEGYEKTPTWDYDVRLYDENITQVGGFSIKLQSVKLDNPAMGGVQYKYSFPCALQFHDNNCQSYTQTFTRTLFNDDDRLEYVTSDEGNAVVDGSLKGYKGFKIYAEDGAVLKKVSLPSGYLISEGNYMYVYMLNGCTYLRVDTTKDGLSYGIFYRIDKASGSVSYVNAVPSKMEVRSGEGVVTVELPSGMEYSRIELVDMSGRVMGSVQANGDKVSVDTSRLSSGTYVLRAAGASGSECAKIVVR